MAPGDCPVEGCKRVRGDQKAMCKTHWFMVGQELRDEVYATARAMWAGRPGADEEWSEALSSAIAEVELKEAA